jgi:hypothetical protein
MKRPTRLMALIALAACLLWGVWPGRVWAEEQGSLSIAGFQVGGSVEAGWRLVDIDGSRDRYKEVVNLFDGPRLFDLNLWGRSAGGGPVDYFSLTANGIGDPFPFARLQVKKDKAYDLSGTYREYRWSFNREDDGLLTDNHDFHSIRRSGSVNLAVLPSDDLRLSMGYRHADREGDGMVPRPFLVVDSQIQDFHERLDEVFAAADLRAGAWNFHLKQSYWTYKNTDDIDGPAQIEGRDQRVDTYVTTLKAHTKLGERLDLDAGYIYAHSETNASLFTNPVILVNPGDAHLLFNTHVGEMGLSFLLIPKVILHLDYRFHTLSQAGRSNTDEPPFTNNVDVDFRQFAHTGTFQVEYLPLENLTLRAGYRAQYRNVDTDGQEPTDPKAGEDTLGNEQWVHGWIGSAQWKPVKSLSILGEYQGADFSNPYTWISPESENIAKARIRWKTPLESLSLYTTFLWRRRSNPDQEYRVDTKDYIFGAAYQPKFAPGLSLDASITYEKLQDKKDFLLTPPTPFTRFSFDSDAIIYTGSIGYEGIFKGLGARLYGSYAQSRGENDERLADLALRIWYKNPYVTPVVTLERTYLVDHTRPNDGFDANMVTFSLRKEF